MNSDEGKDIEKFQPKNDLDSPLPEIEEYDIPFLKIPNGYPSDDKIRTELNREHEPSEEELRKFFTPEVLQRIIYCPKINVDLTDDAGMYGYEPGYIFVCKSRYKGFQSISDQLFFEGRSTQNSITTKEGVEILTIRHYDFFPRAKFQSQTITQRRTPKTFRFLNEIIRPQNALDKPNK